MTEKQNFDPSKYLTRVGKGERAADYLEVKWRLVWLRDVAPDAVLRTEHIRIDDEAAIFKASITLPSGGHADGYGNVRSGEFPDYIGKAETVAIGRALAALGFGTQFAGDFAEEEKVVDAPVRRGQPSPKSEDKVVSIAAVPSPKRPDDDEPITPDVVAALIEAARKNGWNESALSTEARRLYDQADLAMLTVGQGRELYRWAVKAKAS